MSQPMKGIISDMGYEVVASVQGSVGAPPVALGTKGHCRFCGTEDPGRFGNVSHTVPEALGNKWVVSLDECDDCNKLFAPYDDALAKAVGPVLTLGGTPGKRNRVRQTGRTGGASVIRHGVADGRRRLSMEMRDQPFGDAVRLDPIRGVIRFTTPVPPEPLIPRYAAKALAKAALAIMPDASLPRFSRLRAWVLDRAGAEPMGPIRVGVSFGSVGNAPPLVAAVLLRPTDCAGGPDMAVVLSIGSVCLQMALAEDGAANGPVAGHVPCAVRHRNVVQDADGDIAIDYGEPRILDWSSPALEPQPLEAIVTDFNIRTSEGRITPVFRDGA